MKKLLLFLPTFLLAAGLCGCEKRLEPMQLRAAQLDEEAQQVLDLTGNELTLWDYQTDGSSYEMVMTLWVCQNGIWEERHFFTASSTDEDRLGVRLTDSQVEYITIEEDGCSRYAASCPVDVTEESGACSYSSLTGESLIEPGVEIPLLARLGWKDSTAPTPTDWQHFQDSGCDIGVAVTVTFNES